ncbi:unnamed protein product [Penicillium camemberti]|uniref:Str. FM013 n=1 Tax=Penicillium camemberti (strain FM 013) TaxID=1429867 RepID=A0A0G4PQW7_PENC3|nr:unnamed protein product [Penicillium camemberti]
MGNPPRVLALMNPPMGSWRVTDVEWRQIGYLVHLTKPFFQFTMALMKTRDVTIHSVFLVYRKLLAHIERSNRRLKRKLTPWKKDRVTTRVACRPLSRGELLLRAEPAPRLAIANF